MKGVKVGVDLFALLATPMRYRRIYQNGGCYFFTVVTAGRQPILTCPASIQVLRDAFRTVRRNHPFTLDAIVILPDHLHCLWTLPANDADFSKRWRLIKTYFSRHSGVRGPCWQRRFWEHCIRDDTDFAQHLTYIHYNPVKHGLVAQASEWPYSSFHRHVRRGVYPADWGLNEPEIADSVGRE